jgi:hypothetical protein
MLKYDFEELRSESVSNAVESIYVTLSNDEYAYFTHKNEKVG